MPTKALTWFAMFGLVCASTAAFVVSYRAERAFSCSAAPSPASRLIPIRVEVAWQAREVKGTAYIDPNDVLAILPDALSGSHVLLRAKDGSGPLSLWSPESAGDNVYRLRFGREKQGIR